MDKPQITLEQITTEILAYKRQLAKSMIGYGKALIGEGATLTQIANLIGPKFDIPPSECLEILRSCS